MAGCLREAAVMAKHAWAERRRKHMTQAAHYKQQCKTGWKESFHLSQVSPIITYAVFNLRTAVDTRGYWEPSVYFRVSKFINAAKGTND